MDARSKIGMRGRACPLTSSEDEDEKRERQWKNETREEKREEKRKKEEEEKKRQEGVRRRAEASRRHAEEEKRKEEERKKEEEKEGKEATARKKTEKRRAQRRALKEEKEREAKEAKELEEQREKRKERQDKEREEDLKAIAEMPDSAVLDIATWASDTEPVFSDRDDDDEFEWRNDDDDAAPTPGPKFTDEEKAKMTFKERLAKCGEIRVCGEEEAKELVAEWESEGIPLRICESWRSRGYEGHVAVPKAKSLVAQYARNRANVSRIWRRAGMDRAVLDKVILKTLKHHGVLMFWELYPEQLREVVNHARRHGEVGIGELSRCRRRRAAQYDLQQDGIGDMHRPNNDRESTFYDDRTIMEREAEEKRDQERRKYELWKQRAILKAQGKWQPPKKPPVSAPPAEAASQPAPLKRAPLPPPIPSPTVKPPTPPSTEAAAPSVAPAPAPLQGRRPRPPKPPGALAGYYRVQKELKEFYSRPPQPFRPFNLRFGEQNYSLEGRDAALRQKEKLNKVKRDSLAQQLKRANHEAGLLHAERKKLETLKAKVKKMRAEVKDDFRKRQRETQIPSSSRGEEEGSGIGTGPLKGPEPQPAPLSTPSAKRRRIVVKSTEETPPFSHFPAVENRASECVWDTRNYVNPGHRPCTTHWCMFCRQEHPIHFEQIRARRVVNAESAGDSDARALQDILDPVTAEEEEELLGAVGGVE